MECSMSARRCIQACPGPGALSSLSQPFPAESSQVRAQEPCPAAQRPRESAYRSGSSGSLPEKLQGPGVLLSAQDGKPCVSRHWKTLSWTFYFFYFDIYKEKSCFYICDTGSQPCWILTSCQPCWFTNWISCQPCWFYNFIQLYF